MFNRAIHTQVVPKYLRSDHDPLPQFHQWQANLRFLEIQEIKTVPYVPLPHPFVERLGSIRRECLDHVIILNEDFFFCFSQELAAGRVFRNHNPATHLTS
jgi:hypothetical protein